jgi:hypothetical protein
MTTAKARALQFLPQRPDHIPPEALTDSELAHSIDSLDRKLRSARQAYYVAQTAGITLTVGVLTIALALLYFGPTPFLERVFGQSAPATTYDVFLWWIAVLVLAVAAGAFGDQVLRGRVRMARGWKNRVAELERRLGDAENVQRRRNEEHRGRRVD